MKNNFHLIISEDDYTRREEIEKIIAKVLPEKKDRTSALVRVSIQEFSEETIASMKGLSFFTSHQVFVLSTIEKAKKKQLELLAAYCDAPADFTTLILEGATFDGRDNQTKHIRERCTIHEIRKQYDSSQRGIIFEKVKKSGCRIHPDAVELLIERSGGSAAYLSSALDKLLLGVAGSTDITLDAVASLIENHASFDVYKLTNAIADRDLGKALEVLDFLLSEGTREVEIIGMMGWQIRRFYEAKIMLEKHRAKADICKKLRVYGKFSDQFIHHVRSFSKRELFAVIEALLTIDSKAKLSASDTRKELEMLLVRLCGKKLL